jgi:hypothetical protein
MKRSEQSYFDSYGKIGIHHEMLSDRVIVFLWFFFIYSFVFYCYNYCYCFAEIGQDPS